MEHLFTYINPPSERDLERVCRLLDDDGVIAYPTDINWAFGCDAASVKALDRIRRLKPHHPKERPFSLVCSDISMAAGIGLIDSYMYTIFKKVLPGPYTMILKSQKTLARQIKDPRKTVGVRIPDSALIAALVERYKKPLATASVPNIPGDVQPRFGYEVFEHFGHGIDLLLDLGKEVEGQESTIVDFTSGQAEVVRLGAGEVSFFV